MRLLPWALLGLLLLMGDKARKFLTPVKGRVSSKFGDRISPITGEPAFHNGVDIAVPTGTPIASPAQGIIASIYRTDRGGLQTIIEHPDGFTSGYAHLSKVYFGPHVNIPAGQVIAESGDTGKVTAPHLHFSWKKNGVYEDPEKYFQF